MKWLLLLVVCIVAANAALIENKIADDKSLANLLKDEPKVDTRTFIDYDYVTFNLYTKKNPNKPQQLNANKPSINVSNFNATHRTVIIIHDWKSNYNDRLNTGLTKAYLEKGKYNVISVDWGKALTPYDSAVDAIPDVGARTANLIDFLNNHYGPLGFVSLVGHGLGAHIAGSAGQQIQSGRLGKIVGLDPKSPEISYNDVDQRLSPDDAAYVESIQTNGGQWGWDPPIGRANFYPNGGQVQPGCGKDITGECSHWLAVDYYIEAVKYNNFKTNKCQSYQQANSKQCESTFSDVRLGGPRNYQRLVSGIFYVPVNAQSLYGTAQVEK